MAKRIAFLVAILNSSGCHGFQERRRCVNTCTDPLSCTLGGGTAVKGVCTGIFTVCCQYYTGSTAPRHRWRSKQSTLSTQALEFKPSQPDPVPGQNTGQLPPIQSIDINLAAPFKQPAAAFQQTVNSHNLAANQGPRNPRHLNVIFKGRPRPIQFLRSQGAGGQRIRQHSIDNQVSGIRQYGTNRFAGGKRTPRFNNNHHIYTTSNNLPVTHWKASPKNLTNLIKQIKVKRPEESSRLRRPISNHISGSNQECGVSQAAQARILGGLDAGNGQFPWAALIHIKGPEIDKLCAGTLISSRHVITAGHCTSYCRFISIPECTEPIPMKELIFKVTLGEYDYENTNYEQVQTMYAINAYVHPFYKSNLRIREDGYLESDPHYDVSLLELESHVKPSLYISPICLPDPQDDSFGFLATVIGWGRVYRDPGTAHSSVLQATTVPLLTPEECNQLDPSLNPTEDQLCAGLANAENSACPGDSGGGLMSRNADGVWFLHGIVSTGPAVCGLTPVIYHNVSASLSWIQTIIHQPIP